MRLIASERDSAKNLSYILFDEGNDWEHSAGFPIALHIVKFLHTPKQALIAEQEFVSVEEAMDFCRRKYSIEKGEWQSIAPFTLDLHIEYGLTHTGTPQPVLSYPQGGAIAFRVTENPRGSNPDGSPYDLEICGTREGLRRLAAWLVVCAESEHFDAEYHHHFENGTETEGNTSVTIRSPQYLNILRKISQENQP